MATASSRSIENTGENGAGTEAISPVPDDLRYIARQPILDAHGKVHGYELLFRRGQTSVAFDGDGDAATRTVLDNTVMFGTERLTAGLPMFVNCTREALLNGLVKVLPPRQTVLELLETLEPDEALVQACRELKTAGYRLALDDFVWKPSWRPLLEIASYVKVEWTGTTPRQRAELQARIVSSPTQLIAERVETQQDFAQARREGFRLFQGYFFCRPQIMENRKIPSNRLVHLEIIHAALQQPLDVKRMSDLVKREPSLAYRLLRMANSPIYATRQAVSSIQGALVMIGDEMFRRVAILAAAVELRGGRSTEFLRMAFLRGRFCELAAPMAGLDPTEQYLLGIVSLFPAMLNVSMESIARALPLRREVHLALLGESNPERRILSWLESYELGQWERCDEFALVNGLEVEGLPRIYAVALLWADLNVSLASE